MIMVIGGKGQGKRAFAEQNLIFFKGPGLGHGSRSDEFHESSRPPRPSKGQEASRPPGPSKAVKWASGGDADWDSYMKSRYCCDFHLFVKRLMDGGAGVRDAVLRPGDEKQMEGILTALLEGVPDRILVTDEIGSGIVPADAFLRLYREEAGRLCCLAAEKSEQVWRVCCGLGQRIK